MATLPCIYFIIKTKMRLPYDISLSHHQLLFNCIFITCWQICKLF